VLSVGRFRRRCQRSFLRSSHRSTNIAFSVSNNATRPKRTRAYEAADRYRFDRPMKVKSFLPVFAGALFSVVLPGWC
jgi:hypothetical protein